MATENKTHGIISEFTTPKDIYHAAEIFRDAGFKKFEVYTPFPIHGMDDAMGIRPTILPWIILCCGITGLAIGIILSTWSSSETWLFGIEGGYKMIISGKPDSFEGIYEFIPVIFETTILLSAFGAVFGMIGLNGLPTLYHPLFTHDSFVEKASDDGFFLCVESSDPLYNEDKIKELFEKAGGENVTQITD
ncbi:MAG: DUF3341 domain-containing protein [Lentisphaerales bacterium]|nr:DUF3341 domain-containing protein [Lentisphaerales bacterium]